MHSSFNPIQVTYLHFRCLWQIAMTFLHNRLKIIHCKWPMLSIIAMPGCATTTGGRGWLFPCLRILRHSSHGTFLSPQKRLKTSRQFPPTLPFLLSPLGRYHRLSHTSLRLFPSSTFELGVFAGPVHNAAFARRVHNAFLVGALRYIFSRRTITFP